MKNYLLFVLLRVTQWDGIGAQYFGDGQSGDHATEIERLQQQSSILQQRQAIKNLQLNNRNVELNQLDSYYDQLESFQKERFSSAEHECCKVFKSFGVIPLNPTKLGKEDKQIFDSNRCEERLTLFGANSCLTQLHFCCQLVKQYSINPTGGDWDNVPIEVQMQFESRKCIRVSGGKFAPQCWAIDGVVDLSSKTTNAHVRECPITNFDMPAGKFSTTHIFQRGVSSLVQSNGAGTISPFVTTSLITSGGNKNTQVSSETSVIDSLEEKHKSYEFSVAVEGSYGPVSGSASADFFSSGSMSLASTEVNIMALKQFGWVKVNTVKAALTDQAKFLLYIEDYSTFKKLFGKYPVLGYQTGCSVLGKATLTSKTVEEKMNYGVAIAASYAGSVNSVGVESSFSSKEESMMSRTEIKTKIKLLGFDPSAQTNIGESISLDGFKRVILSLDDPTACKPNSGTPIKVKIGSWAVFQDFMRMVPVDNLHHFTCDVPEKTTLKVFSQLSFQLRSLDQQVNYALGNVAKYLMHCGDGDDENLNNQRRTNAVTKFREVQKCVLNVTAEIQGDKQQGFSYISALANVKFEEALQKCQKLFSATIDFLNRDIECAKATIDRKVGGAPGFTNDYYNTNFGPGCYVEDPYHIVIGIEQRYKSQLSWGRDKESKKFSLALAKVSKRVFDEDDCQEEEMDDGSWDWVVPKGYIFVGLNSRWNGDKNDDDVYLSFKYCRLRPAFEIDDQSASFTGDLGTDRDTIVKCPGNDWSLLTGIKSHHSNDWRVINLRCGRLIDNSGLVLLE